MLKESWTALQMRVQRHVTVRTQNHERISSRVRDTILQSVIKKNMIAKDSYKTR